ncbi:hypothetical protein LCGC14_1641410 [marine sediment metagenome]|uniref:Uncharacterized protein n=1 Tax=marine sediment metagenome TaxID=412755 RepID=A0A0F9I058_9ZZZZ
MFNDEVVARAIELVIGSGSIYQAHRALEEEMKGQHVPVYESVRSWAHQSKEAMEAVHADNKREMVAIASDAARAWGQRAVEAAVAIKEDGSYAVPHGQVMVPYGIAMQRRTDWENVGSKGNQMNVQFNLVTRD